MILGMDAPASHRRYKRRRDPMVNARFRAALPPVVSCAYCNMAMLREEATIDHIIPLARKGGKAAGNLAPACGPCNSAKGNKMLWEVEIPYSRVVRSFIIGCLSVGAGFEQAWARVQDEGIKVGEIYFWEIAARVARDHRFALFGPGSRWGTGEMEFWVRRAG